MDSKTIQLILNLYQNGKGTMQISQELNLHRTTIQKYLKLNNIELRKRSSKSNYNINFFSSFSKESCYWAGFIMADGCIRKNTLHIKLAIKDKEHLQKFLNSINSNHPIYIKKDYVYISISGKWFLQDLKDNFNILPRKTYIAEFPLQLPTEFYSDFIRGYFDGDGCITKTSCPTINFVGTINILNNLNLFFNNLDIKLKSGNKSAPIQKTKTNNIGSIHYSGKNAQKILNKLYLNTDNKLRLDRKYERYINYFN